MCISPSSVWVQRGPNWVKEPVACRQCWRCKQNRVNDYVGRALAEAQTSSVCATLTLTYAPRSDLADKVLHPRHFQLFMKLLRRAGHKVRYLVAGEYGDMKGRAHFHAILFFEKLCPPDGPAPFYNPDHLNDPLASPRFSRLIPHKRMCHIREWPHGHIICDWSASETSMRYVCKYLLKAEAGSRWFSLSKKPAIGAAWFARKAQRAIDFGVLPFSFEYMPPGGRRDRSYLMTGATRRDFINAITTDPAMRGRMSEWVQKTFDKYQRERVRAVWDAFPPETQFQAMCDHMERVQAQKAAMMAGDKFRQISWLEDLILNSPDGIIYRSDNGGFHATS